MAAVADIAVAPAPTLRSAAEERPRLRIGVFADSALQPRWMVEALARIAGSDYADIVLVAVSQRDTPAAPLLLRAWRHLDGICFGTRGELSAPVDLRAALPHARPPLFLVADGDAATAWRKLCAASQPLDVAFVLGALDDDEFENIARYGIWRYCFGAEHGTREDLAGWREVAEQQPVTASGLKIHLWPGIDQLAYESRARTHPFSLQRNRDNLFHKTAQFAERELRMLHRLGSAHLRMKGAVPPAPAVPSLSSARPASRERAPAAGELLKGMARLGGRILQRGMQKLLCVDQWFIAYRFGEPGWDGNLDRYVRLLPPTDRIWADPFPLHRDGRYYIFFEEVPFATGRGHIAAIEVHPDGTHSAPLKVLERDYHLSYPFLIEHDGELFMVPESGENRSVELYRCVQFPDVWQLEKVLLRNVACADATFHRGADRWWMFVNIGAAGTELYDELHLYYADDLRGDWQPHSNNPVKSDVRSARPAGALYTVDGVLHRPAQICAPLYGSGIAIAQVRQLTPHAYQEVEVAHLLPPRDRGVLGMHTINRSGELNVIDGFIRRRRL